MRPGAQHPSRSGKSRYFRPGNGPEARNAGLLLSHRAAEAVLSPGRTGGRVAAAKFGTMFGVSSLGTVSLEELCEAYDTPQVYQFYFHKDRAPRHDTARQRGGCQHNDVDGRDRLRPPSIADIVRCQRDVRFSNRPRRHSSPQNRSSVERGGPCP